MELCPAFFQQISMPGIDRILKSGYHKGQEKRFCYFPQGIWHIPKGIETHPVRSGTTLGKDRAVGVWTAARAVAGPRGREGGQNV